MFKRDVVNLVLRCLLIRQNQRADSPLPIQKADSSETPKTFRFCSVLALYSVLGTDQSPLTKNTGPRSTAKHYRSQDLEHFPVALYL